MPPSSVSRAWMRELDRRAIEEYGIPGLILMENAGRGAFELLWRELLHECATRSVLVLCGRGNNGGDGFVVARHLHNRGADVRVLRVGDASPFEAGGDAGLNGTAFERLGGEIRRFPEDADVAAVVSQARERSEVLVDGVFGTGLRGPMRSPVADLIVALAAIRAPTLALDLPSGLDADTGEVLGACLPAAITATFGLAKHGLLRGRGPALCGRVAVVDISLPRALIEAAPEF